jgi:predicted ATPase/class 3 adenylate cyclase
MRWGGSEGRGVSIASRVGPELAYGAGPRKAALGRRRGGSRHDRDPTILYALPTKTLTFLFTDIEGSTALLRRVGHETYADILAAHHALIRTDLAAHDGEEVGTQGDGFFAVFPSATACVSAAIGMQRALAAQRWPGDEHVRVRMGIHSGEASETVTGLVGLAIHRAARVAAVAHGGQILLSATAVALVRQSLPVGASVADLGPHRLKDLGQPEEIFQLNGAGLETVFSPLRSLDNPALANNLPAQSATFVGRDVEVDEVRRLVEAGRLVTLTGAGGSGKTRLALQVAAELLDGSGDGVWLVELAPVSDPEVVASAVGEVLGVASPAGRPALDALLDALEPQNILIVLDNCEHLIGECAKVAEAILRRCPQVHLMTTSREPLGIGGETIYRVPSLSLPGAQDGEGSPTADSDAVALFVDRVAAQGVELVLDQETGPLVASICRRLDGMPLAIELAAARMRSLSLASLHERLDQRFRLLTGGGRNALPRQQTLRATVDWSYSLLNGPEQSVLLRLSVFVEGFDLEAAEAVCGFGDIEAFDVTDLLGSLVDKSLVVAEPDGGVLRYRLLETIRQFAGERLVELDTDEAASVAAAHCAHFLSVAERAAPHLAGPDQAQWLARLETERANVRRAIQHAAGEDDGTGLALRFAVALRRYLWARERGEAGLALFTPVLERQDAHSDPELLAGALVTITFVARNVDTAMAKRVGAQAVELARKVDNPALLTQSLAMFCCACYFTGDHKEGLPFGAEAVDLARALQDDVLLGESLVMYMLCSRRVQPDHTDELIAEALACTRRSGDRFLTMILRNNAAVYAIESGDMTAARAHLEEARRAMPPNAVIMNNISINLAWVLREEGDADSSARVFGDSLRLSRRTGDHPGSAYCCLGLACLAGDRGDGPLGAVLHGISQAFFDRTGEPCQEPEDTYRLRSTTEIRSQLEEEEFERLYAEGEQLHVDEALTVALKSISPA